MNTTESFLQSYSELEGLLKKSSKLPDTVLDYETTLDAENQEKLKLCRQIRNYCRHHKDYKNFISVSENMVEFLDDIKAEVLKSFDLIKNHIVKIKTVSESEKISDAITVLSKSPAGIVALIDKDGAIRQYLTNEMIILALGNGLKLTSKLNSLETNQYQKKQPKFNTVDVNDILSEVDVSKPVLVFEKDKLKGMLKV